MNKYINKIKTAITTVCNLKCDYCFVRKTDKTMSFDVARKILNLLLSSAGQDKLFSIYGGEPFTAFELIKKMVLYAKAKAKENAKNLTISICTNFTLTNEEHLHFLKEHNIKLIISMVGRRKYHDRTRRLYNNSGTYDRIVDKLPLLFKIMHPDNIGLSFCVFPSTAGMMEDNFYHLIRLGFNYINLEIIREYDKWSYDKIRQFIIAFNRIVRYVLLKISEENFIFLNPINWEIKHNILSKSQRCTCPFNYKLEVYPKGELAFSPFLLNSPHRDEFIIGNINEPQFRKMSDCRFNIKSKKCQKCESDYFSGYNNFDREASEVYNLYHWLCLRAAKEIQVRANTSKLFRSYIEKIKEGVCF